jgi:hypothetical protein
MASFKYTFASGDTLTPARLNDARDVFDIVNADIKSDAAIAGTKIVPNFGSQNVTGAQIISLASGGEGGQLSLQNAAGNDVGAFVDIDANNILRIYNAQNTSIVLVTNNVERMLIASNGFVGIGTTSPAARLNVVGEVLIDGAGGEGGQLSLRNTGNNAGAYIDIDGVNNLRIVNQQNTPTLFFTNNIERMRIAAGGNVGIGTTSPSSLLHVAGDLTISSATTATTATAGAETLPANPEGFLVVSINGTSRKIPYYAT